MNKCTSSREKSRFPRIPSLLHQWPQLPAPLTITFWEVFLEEKSISLEKGRSHSLLPDLISYHSRCASCPIDVQCESFPRAALNLQVKQLCRSCWPANAHSHPYLLKHHIALDSIVWSKTPSHPFAVQAFWILHILFSISLISTFLLSSSILSVLPLTNFSMQSDLSLISWGSVSMTSALEETVLTDFDVVVFLRSRWFARGHR